MAPSIDERSRSRGTRVRHIHLVQRLPYGDTRKTVPDQSRERPHAPPAPARRRGVSLSGGLKKTQHCSLTPLRRLAARREERVVGHATPLLGTKPSVWFADRRHAGPSGASGRLPRAAGFRSSTTSRARRRHATIPWAESRDRGEQRRRGAGSSPAGPGRLSPHGAPAPWGPLFVVSNRLNE
jgi:hypothetical protein